MKTKIDIISPDGFSFFMDYEEMPSNLAECIDAMKTIKKRYAKQGYYSSSKHGNIPLDELPNFCTLKEISIEELDQENIYILVPWPESQDYMEFEWFQSEAVLHPDLGSAYFIPIKYIKNN